MAPLKSIFTTSKKAVDPTLDALFSSSAGPVKPLAKPKYSALVAPKPQSKPVTKAGEEENGEEDEENDDDDGDEAEEEQPEEKKAVVPAGLENSQRKRKRKAKNDDEDLEAKYLDKITREDTPPAEKRPRVEAADEKTDEEEEDDTDAPIVHESLLKANGNGDEADANLADFEKDKDKAARTVFLSNVSLSAVTSRAAKRTLVAHLESVSSQVKEGKKKEKEEEGKEEEEKEKEEKEKEKESSVVESLRFRSVPFASAALPKRAAFITGAVMGATAQSTNAYAVYTTAALARQAVRKLNGTVVLDRHLRADSVAHPSPVDQRRCVFVGNLGFVDDESILEDKEGEAAQKRKRHKVPMDVEEGLWRTFGEHAGKVESVRVVRDPVTRVGKGIAYVQFYDATSVEAALLLADKKFPPQLPRALRVSRCKAPHKTARAVERTVERANKMRQDRDRTDNKGRVKTAYAPTATAEQQTLAGRAAKLLGRTAAEKPVVFEGMRARVGPNGSGLFKKGRKAQKGGQKPGGPKSNNQDRRERRAAAWKQKGKK